MTATTPDAATGLSTWIGMNPLASVVIAIWMFQSWLNRKERKGYWSRRAEAQAGSHKKK